MRHRHGAPAAIVAGLLLAALASAATAAHHLVRPDGSGDFPTIQEAILCSAEGDTILLADGVFRGTGNCRIDLLGYALTVRSQTGDASACIIDIEGTPEDQRFGFQFIRGEGADTRIESLTLRNGCDLGC
ncbi:MAG: hypothetical protein GF330_12575 [Candidatus Eisenbacteria bacterium]|nr:hypothetical protein [Candidatus Eisenbacteria bacterium]